MVRHDERTPPGRPVRSYLLREMVRFGLVGGAGVVVNLLAFNLLRHDAALPVVRASVLATVISIACNYAGFRYFTYRNREKGDRPREVTLFLVFSAIGLVIENGTLFVATYEFGWDSPLQSNMFKFIGIGIATLFRFWSYRSWVFTLPRLARSGTAQDMAPAQQRPSAQDVDETHGVRSP
jgi:putative flippase GtrA